MQGCSAALALCLALCSCNTFPSGTGCHCNLNCLKEADTKHTLNDFVLGNLNLIHHRCVKSVVINKTVLFVPIYQVMSVQNICKFNEMCHKSSCRTSLLSVECVMPLPPSYRSRRDFADTLTQTAMSCEEFSCCLRLYNILYEEHLYLYCVFVHLCMYQETAERS
jgi:hypothetical protein